MIRGVGFNQQTGKWRAQLRGYRRCGYIGEFLTVEEAVAARRGAELELHGRHHDQADIQIEGATARVPLWGRHGVLRGWSLIDTADLPLVREHRWSLNPNGYAVARMGGRVIAMHAVLIPDAVVRDHINGDTLDNRRENLRGCLPRENSRNSAATRGRALFKGVSATAAGRYRARLMLNRREVWLGSYATPEDAARAYDAGARRLFGEFARVNFATSRDDA